jgi:hypothetical protein
MKTHDRGALKVEGGFWEGISINNLYTAFAPPEPVESDAILLADYDRLFGQDFPHCRKDIRPFLEPWAQHISLDEDPSDESDDEALSTQVIDDTLRGSTAVEHTAAGDAAGDLMDDAATNNTAVDDMAADGTAVNTAMDYMVDLSVHDVVGIIPEIASTSKAAVPEALILRDDSVYLAD